MVWSVDGLLVLSTLALMIYYSVLLASVVATAVCFYIVYRVVRFRNLRFQSFSQILAKENTNFLENIRAIRAIKIFGRKAERQSIWQNFYSATINTGFRVNRVNIFFTMANGFLFGIEEILVIFLCARMILDGGGFTVGMMSLFCPIAASSSKNPWASSTRLSISRCSTFISIASPISRSRPKKRD